MNEEDYKNYKYRLKHRLPLSSIGNALADINISYLQSIKNKIELECCKIYNEIILPKQEILKFEQYMTTLANNKNISVSEFINTFNIEVIFLKILYDIQYPIENINKFIKLQNN